jgi:NAD(P)-dependent dehydrogenase (short-subunit alcohol dehydrogenase family)
LTVNVLGPGPIATPMQEEVLTKEAKEMFESLIPRGTMGQLEEIATVALSLASDDSSFVNGSWPSTGASRPSDVGGSR